MGQLTDNITNFLGRKQQSRGPPILRKAGRDAGERVELGGEKGGAYNPGVN